MIKRNDYSTSYGSPRFNSPNYLIRQYKIIKLSCVHNKMCKLMGGILSDYLFIFSTTVNVQ